MTWNCPSSRSSKLEVKYFKNGDRYDVGSIEVEKEVSHGLSIDTITFDLG